MTFQTERRTLRSECCAAIFLFWLFGIVVFSQDRLTLTYKLFGFPDFGRTYLLSANVRLFSSYAKSLNTTFTAGPTP